MPESRSDVDEPVDAAAGGVVGALRRRGLVARVVDDEARCRGSPWLPDRCPRATRTRPRAHVPPAPPKPLCTQTVLMPLSRTRSRNACPTWGAFGSWSSRYQPGRGRVRVHLPGADRVLVGECAHGVEPSAELADRRHRLAVHDDPAVAAQRVGGAARLVHVRGGERAAVVTVRPGSRSRRPGSCRCGGRAPPGIDRRSSRG